MDKEKINGGCTDFQNNHDNLFGKINTENKRFQVLETSLQNRLIDLANNNKHITSKSRGQDGIKKHNIHGTVVYIFKSLTHQKRIAFILEAGMLEMMAVEDGGGSNTTEFLIEKVRKMLNERKAVPEIPTVVVNTQKGILEERERLRKLCESKLNACGERERELTLEFVKNSARQELLTEILNDLGA